MLPYGITCTASSSSCKVEAVRHVSRPLYAVQYHPEVEHSEYGEELFQNFLDIVEEFHRN